MNKSKFILQSIVVLIFDLLFRPFWPELMLSTVFILYMLIICDDLYNLIPWWTAVVIVFGVFSGLSIWFYVGIMFLIYAIVYISKKIISYSNESFISVPFVTILATSLFLLGTRIYLMTNIKILSLELISILLITIIFTLIIRPNAFKPLQGRYIR